MEPLAIPDKDKAKDEEDSGERRVQKSTPVVPAPATTRTRTKKGKNLITQPRLSILCFATSETDEPWPALSKNGRGRSRTG